MFCCFALKGEDDRHIYRPNVESRSKTGRVGRCTVGIRRRSARLDYSPFCCDDDPMRHDDGVLVDG